MNWKIYWIKFKTFFEVQASRFVYNFNKFIPNVKSKNNVKYISNGNKFNKLDIFYPNKFYDDDIPVVVYFHGGGWAAYSKDCYRTVCKRLASLGYVVFNCNYSLTPKYKMPRIISDCASAVKFAINSAGMYGGNPNKICLAGDSAGGHISSLISGLATSGEGEAWFGKELNDEFAHAIKANLLFYGAFDLNSIIYTEFMNIDSYINAIVDMKSEDACEILKKYSSVSYVTKRFPPSLIASGVIDKLHDSQSAVFAEMLEQNDVYVEKVFFELEEFRAMHAYLVVDGLKTTETTFNCVEGFLNEVFKK